MSGGTAKSAASSKMALEPTNPTDRAMAICLRTYHRPLEDDVHLERWDQVVDRVIRHQEWLWVRAKGSPLEEREFRELEDLREHILHRYIAPAGRTLFLGGTELSRRRESCMYNCSFTIVETVYDLVDVLWLLLQGCGVGFKPVTGTLNGFACAIPTIEVVRSTRATGGGRESNRETWDPDTRTWTISVGDSAVAWAKAVGKLMAGKYPAAKLVLDFSEIRPPGTLLKGYKWRCSGDAQIANAFKKISEIMSTRADQLLTKMDILDIVNLLGTMLSSRRSAEIALCDYGDSEWREFATAKKDFWVNNAHRQQSNNSLVFQTAPSVEQVEELFEIIQEGGGSEPGLFNLEAARKRAPWTRGCNPCGEILLANKSFCNLTEVNIAAFKEGNKAGLERALVLAGRMNYRQTNVDLRDEILQEAWHLSNQFLRLCGVGLTGIVARPDLQPYDFRRMRNIATHAAYSMAEELKLPYPKNVTCIKPSGTLSKIMSTAQWGEVPEGVHKPLGKYIFNNVTFSRHDPIVERFRVAGYRVFDKPFESESVLVTFPISYANVPFAKKTVTRADGTTEEIEVNAETAVDQLERYKTLMNNWCDQNVSCTVSYDPKEVPAIVSWLVRNWDAYVGVSFLYRADPTKTAKDLGYVYLPQEVVSKAAYDEYVARISAVEYDGVFHSDEMIDVVECAGGACPVR